jgi:hypothetical protein
VMFVKRATLTIVSPATISFILLEQLALTVQT